MENVLYFGDNLEIMRRYVPDDSVDLVYADPPFKSNQNYNVLFQEKDGSRAASQILAFEDTWTWDQEDEAVFADLVTAGGKVADALQSFRQLIGPCDMLSYLVMMAPRLMECRRVLKASGSMYLHCDPAASHYLKLLMDAVFGPANFRTEIVWKRSSAHSDAKQGRAQHGRIHDVILFYTKTDEWFWNQVFTPYDQDYVDSFYKYTEPGTGRRYRLGDLTGPGGAAKGNPSYEVMGVTRFWRYSKEKMAELIQQGRVVQTKPGAVPAYKRYLDEMQGVPLQDWWGDIGPIAAQAAERLGYPTQKPVALLERIIRSSCPEGGAVLDPFCGCGTTITAAQSLGRAWIGIDITHLAITLMKERLKDTFGDAAVFKVVGEPVSVPDAERLAASDPYQFQWWALGLVGARPVEGKKGADKGIDGKIVFQGDAAGKFETVILSVKAGNTGVAHVRDLRGVVERDKAAVGVVISMQDHTGPMHDEAVTAGFFESKTWGRRYPKIQLLTVADLLAGKQIDMPPIKQVGATFKKAPRAAAPAAGTQAELPVNGGGRVTGRGQEERGPVCGNRGLRLPLVGVLLRA
jgi:DNA modification methylase